MLSERRQQEDEAVAGAPPSSSERFSNRIADYDRYRPTYPPQVINDFAETWGLRAGQVAADVGAGTGIFTALLLSRGLEVEAIEPNEGMRKLAADRFRVDRRCRVRPGTAERTGLPDRAVDWVFAAQAFHWFDVDVARIELRRILRDDRGGGGAALLWNNRLEDGPFLSEYEAFLHEYGIDYARVKHQSAEQDGRITRFFGNEGFALRSFRHDVSMNLEGLIGRTASCSYMPARDHPRYPATVARLGDIFTRHQSAGAVTFEYEVRMYVGRPGSG
ncbi:MAG: hypothetical protein FLDDKLPJ_00216 [Phycisphaerae bacterium]|nr:hypothetical protein [Phycisphaerae bacterium]